MNRPTSLARTVQKVAVMGATGSVGTSALDVIARHPDRFHANVLVANSRVDQLVALCERFRPTLAVIADASLESEFAAKLKAAHVHCDVAAGPSAVVAAAASEASDIVIAAIVGAAGLDSTLAAAHAGKRLLLANKESIVMAGPLLLAAVRAGGGELIPIDSEHNAIYQCLPGGTPNLDQAGVRRLILTASGGPFMGRRRAELGEITPAQAIAHPTWQMGAKISVDSATLMNKGLEVIEAHMLFGAPVDRIDVVVHPQSIVHSLVEYLDGSVLAQLGTPDMRTAIAQALAWPERIASGVAALDLAAGPALEFRQPDIETFRCLGLAYDALREGDDAPAILNAANEMAVSAFLAGRLGFLGIADVIEATLNEMPAMPLYDIASVRQRANAAQEVATRQVVRFEKPRR